MVGTSTAGGTRSSKKQQWRVPVEFPTVTIKPKVANWHDGLWENTKEKHLWPFRRDPVEEPTYDGHRTYLTYLI